MRDDFPAIFRNEQGEHRFVPDIVSCPIGFFRAEMSVEEFERLQAGPAEFMGEPEPLDAMTAAVREFKAEPKMDPVDETPEDEREEPVEPTPADALAGWAQR